MNTWLMQQCDVKHFQDPISSLRIEILCWKWLTANNPIQHPTVPLWWCSIYPFTYEHIHLAGLGLCGLLVMIIGEQIYGQSMDTIIVGCRIICQTWPKFRTNVTCGPESNHFVWIGKWFHNVQCWWIVTIVLQLLYPWVFINFRYMV